MSITFHISDDIESGILMERFGKFSNSLSDLPNCSVFIRKIRKAESITESAFHFLFNDNNSIIKMPDFNFTAYKDGVAVIRQKYAFSWVHENFKTIELNIFNDCPNYDIYCQLLLRAYQYTAIFSDALMIHSAAVSYNGEGILFCGVPGAGKSTQARLWEDTFDAEAINNDEPCIVFKNNKPFVCGSPWSGKEHCFKNISVPIHAIVFIEKSPKDHIERLSTAEALSLLYLNNMVIPFNGEIENKYISIIEKIVSTVPIYKQYCTKTPNAPKELFKNLF